MASRLEKTLEEVRDVLGVGEVVGDGGFVCRSVASLEKAGPDQLSFVRDPSYEVRARESSAGALVVPVAFEAVRSHQLVVPDAVAAFSRVLEWVANLKRPRRPGVHPTACVDPSARVGEEAVVGPGAIVAADAEIGDRSVLSANAFVGLRSKIGDDSVLHPNVVVMEDVTLGRRVVVHAGTVIGSDGYGYFQADGRHHKVPQVGEVIVGDDVEIGALATIDRATLDATEIGRGTKVGDLCHIAHNCRVGEDVLLFPTVSISGSVVVGDRAIFAGRAGCADNLKIGEDAVLGGTAVAFKDVPAGAALWGNPARDKTREMRIQALLGKLPEMRRDLRRLEKTMAESDHD